MLKQIILTLVLFLIFTQCTTESVMAKTAIPNDVKVVSNNKWVVKNPAHPSVLINKTRNLPTTYKPKSLVYGNSKTIKYATPGKIEKNKMSKVAKPPLERMVKDAKKDGVNLYMVSAYRSYNRQNELFNNYTKIHGIKKANTFSAKAGQSEHQTGLAFDFTNKSLKGSLHVRFEKSKEGKWLAKNAHKYGFILRYPKGKEKITGYQYEPWHYRYVGGNVASTIQKEKLTLEEYYTQYVYTAKK